jgi:hypothetical protein
MPILSSICLFCFVVLFQNCGGTHVGDALSEVGVPADNMQLKINGHGGHLLDLQFCVRTLQASAVSADTSNLDPYPIGVSPNEHTYYTTTSISNTPAIEFFVDYGVWYWKTRWYMEGYPANSRTVTVGNGLQNDLLINLPDASYDVFALHSEATSVQTYYTPATAHPGPCVVNSVSGDTFSITNTHGTFRYAGKITVSSNNIVQISASAKSAAVTFDTSSFAFKAKDVTSDAELESLLRAERIAY